jgi:hypothetical protein
MVCDTNRRLSFLKAKTLNRYYYNRQKNNLPRKLLVEAARFAISKQRRKDFWVKSKISKKDLKWKAKVANGLQMPDLSGSPNHAICHGETNLKIHKSLYMIPCQSVSWHRAQPVIIVHFYNKRFQRVEMKHARYLKECITEQQPWLSIQIKYHYKSSVRANLHANMLWLDYKSKTIDFFEPSFHPLYKDKGLYDELAILLKRKQCLKDFVLQPQAYTIPKIKHQQRGPQSFTQDSNCADWCIAYVHLRSLNPDLSGSAVLERFYHHFRSENDNWISQMEQWLKTYKFYRTLMLEPK